MKERSQIEESMNSCLSLERRLDDFVTLIGLGIEESDDEVVADAFISLESLLKDSKVASLEVLLSGEADTNSTFLEIHPGAGGTEVRIGQKCFYACILGGLKIKVIK